jgi:hypothetical protein
LLLVSFSLAGLSSFAALLDRLADGSLPGFPALAVSDQAFYQRLQALGHARFLVLLREVTVALRASRAQRPWVRALAPWASGIFALDDTTLDALVRRVWWLVVFEKTKEVLAGRLGTMIDLTTGKIHEVVYDSDSNANEKTHLLPLLTHVAQGALLVFDLGYFSFPLFDEITARGHFFVTRLRAKTTYSVVQVLAERPLYRDRIIYLGVHRSDRAAHPVRLVEICLDGKWWSYLTNVLDPKKLTAEQVWRLYVERWTIEQVFQTLKRVLGIASLRCSHITSVLAQIWTALTVYQLVQDARLEMALAQNLGADEISWVKVMRRIGNYTMVPGPKPPLREWLSTRTRVAKKGTRQRKLKQLPDAVLADCVQGREEMPEPTKARVRVARHGKPEPRRSSVLTLARLAEGGRADPGEKACPKA